MSRQQQQQAPDVNVAAPDVNVTVEAEPSAPAAETPSLGDLVGQLTGDASGGGGVDGSAEVDQPGIRERAQDLALDCLKGAATGYPCPWRLISQ